MPARRDNPYSSFNFIVDAGGEAIAGFSEVDLPGARIEAIEYREGADKTSAARRLPGRVTYDDVVLRRGLTGGTELYDWFNAIREGVLDRRDVRITLLDEARNPVYAWRLLRAWPTRYELGGLHALGNEVVVETLELAYESFDVD